MIDCREFVDIFLKIDALKLSRERSISDWGGDIPSTILFSNFGKDIVKNFEHFSNIDLLYIFSSIESGMINGDEKLVASIATGLLEAIYSSYNQDHAKFEKILLHLGDVSKKYIIDWGKWNK